MTVTLSQSSSSSWLGHCLAVPASLSDIQEYKVLQTQIIPKSNAIIFRVKLQDTFTGEVLQIQVNFKLHCQWHIVPAVEDGNLKSTWRSRSSCQRNSGPTREAARRRLRPVTVSGQFNRPRSPSQAQPAQVRDPVTVRIRVSLTRNPPAGTGPDPTENAT